MLIQALACGCPVVSTDCPSGPAEILDGGRYGALVPVGDDAAMAAAILATLAHPPERAALAARGAEFSVDRAVRHSTRTRWPSRELCFKRARALTWTKWQVAPWPHATRSRADRWTASGHPSGAPRFVRT